MEILREYTTEHKVWRDGNYVYKFQPKCLTDTEEWCLLALYESGYVPHARRISETCIRMEDLGASEPVTDREEFMSHLPRVLAALYDAGVRHGDLTEYAVIVKQNKPYLIDFAESRSLDDPRPDKRPEGDEFWLTRVMESLCS